MFKNSKSLAIGLVTVIFLGAFSFFLLNGSHKTTGVVAVEQAQAAPTEASPEAVIAEKQEAEPAKNSPDLTAPPAAQNGEIAAAMKDRVIGSDTAPVTIVEYASLTCPHCAHFTKEILPEVKKRLIDTGKARYIFRDFPLDQFALKAAMMARCLPADKYFNMIEVLFSNQERWAHAEDPLQGLAQLGSLAGLDDAAFKNCTQNHELETAVLNEMQNAQNKYQIKSTPTFIFNDGAEQITGAQSVDKYEEIVNKLAKGK
jgi:protein-disulfide isomerase